MIIQFIQGRAKKMLNRALGGAGKGDNRYSRVFPDNTSRSLLYLSALELDWTLANSLHLGHQSFQGKNQKSSPICYGFGAPVLCSIANHQHMPALQKPALIIPYAYTKMSDERVWNKDWQDDRGCGMKPTCWNGNLAVAKRTGSWLHCSCNAFGSPVL